LARSVGGWRRLALVPALDPVVPACKSRPLKWGILFKVFKKWNGIDFNFDNDKMDDFLRRLDVAL
jgi:hypothetical protein